MRSDNYHETLQYRCLNEHFPPLTEDLSLTLCGIEQCTEEKEHIYRVRDGFHLHIILSGEGVLEAGGTQWQLHGGQMFLIKPGEKIGYWPRRGAPWAYCWMSFTGTKAKTFMEDAGFTEGIYSQDCLVDKVRFYRLCERVFTDPQLTKSAAMRRLGLLMQFIGLAMDSAAQSHKRTTHQEKPLMHQKNEYIRYAIEYIQNNYSSIRIADVSRYLGIDRSYFSTIFKESQGISPNEYLLRVRMRQSAYLLRGLDISVQEVGRYVGYEDSLTFSKAFKRFFGISPKHYRELPDDSRPHFEEIVANKDHV